MKLNELSRLRFSVAGLLTNHPAKWKHPNKCAIISKCNSIKPTFRGDVITTRWEAAELSKHVRVSSTAYSFKPGFFVYPGYSREKKHWHLNFANQEIFVGYADGLLAQDELQCLEHPILGNVREALLASPNFKALTKESGRPTPILISGVEQRCKLDTTNLYGNNFRVAPTEEVLRALKVLNPGPVNNIIALEAPFGKGPYRRDQILYILTTASTGFSAAINEGGDKDVVIHTGFWGCGAYGGNQELMAVLQLLAARISGISELVFYTGGKEGQHSYERALKVVSELESCSELSEIINIILAHHYIWGESNGT